METIHSRTAGIRSRHAPTRLRLRDGTPVLIRPVVPGDKDHLRDSVARLSETSRYRRFFAFVKALSDDQLQYLTEIDYRDHMAWIAFDITTPNGLPLGVARYIRLESEPSSAEAAVTVVDSHQGRGLGTLLLASLCRTAKDNEIDSFVAYVLDDNEPMLRIFRDLGARVDREEPGIVRVTVPVPNDPAKLPDTPAGRVFKAVTQGCLDARCLADPSKVDVPRARCPNNDHSLVAASKT